MTLKTYSAPTAATRQLFSDLGGDDYDQMWTFLYEMHNSMQNQKYLLERNHKEELKLFPMSTELTNRVHKQYQENYNMHFIGLLLNSTYVASYSIFEMMFKRVCFYAAEKRNIVIKPDHFRAAKITWNCKDIIQQQIGLDLAKIERHWKRLVLFQELRNKITHHAATIPIGNKPLRAFVRRNEHIHIHNPRTTRELTFYIRDRNFTYDFMDTSRSYLLWILMRI